MDSDGSPTVVLTVANAAWRDAFDALEPLSQHIVQTTLAQAAVTSWLKAGEVSLLLTDDREIQALNATYRSRDRATNVLSFPSLDLAQGKAGARRQPGPVLLGDIAISFDRLQAEAIEQRKNPVDHFAHLTVHGTLHLLGYDHVDDAEAREMEGLEAKILCSLGFAIPYEDLAEVDDLSVAT